jgi:hypothetical protein
MTRSRFALVAGAVAILAVGALWGGLHTRLRLAFWDRVAARSLTDEDHAALAACEGGWWAITRVLEQDVDAPCGEPWLVERVAAQVRGSKDRVAWLTVRTAGAVRARQFRAALVLAAADEPTPVEPAYLLAHARDELPSARLAELLLAAGEGATWADALGSRGVALGRTTAARQGQVAVPEVLPVLRWLAAVGQPEAEEAVSAVASAALGVDDAWLATVRHRREAGLAVWQIPDAWRGPLLAHRDCPAGACSALWVALLALPDDDADGTVAPPAPRGDARLERIARIAGATEDDVVALAWGFDRTAAWVTASPEPAERLASLLGGAPSHSPVPFARTLWDGAGAPFGAALVASALAQVANVPVSIRSAGDGTVWIGLGDVDVVRSKCGASPGGPPHTVVWPAAAVEAAAVAELASATGPEAAGLAAASARLDPLVGEGLVDRVLGPDVSADVKVGRMVGAAVGRPVAPPSGAEDERRQFALSVLEVCSEAVMN